MTQASAPGKVILFGEHSVVYHQPALAIPLSNLRATATVQPAPNSGPETFHIFAQDLEQSFWLHERDDRDPLAYAVRLTLEATGVELECPLELVIQSRIPIASGLGSGAATSIAIIRAIASHFDVALQDQQVSDLAFEVEHLHHGTPSGIDNNVIAYESPLYYVRDQVGRAFSLGQPLHLVLGHCGIASHTGAVVGALRARWQAEPDLYSALFGQVGDLVEQAFQALLEGDMRQVGMFMDRNHSLLQELGVSIDELDQLVDCARAAGALGAKLSGAGAGGFMLALVTPSTSDQVAEALRAAGASHTISTQV